MSSPTSGAPPLRVALVGYGLAGAVFHGPLVRATPDLEVTTIVTADPGRRARAAQDFPRARVVPDAQEVWARAEEHDLVVVASPTASHAPLATRAVDAGLAVVVEKPLAPLLSTARALVERAATARVMLTVFHNRRWDAEHLTLRRLIDDDALGEVVRYESRFERWRPRRVAGAWREELPADDGGGVLLDLGVHLVDQARQLLGPVSHVYGEVAARRGGSDDDVFVALEHRSGAHSHLWASAVAAAPGPRLRVLGTAAAFVVECLDGQEDALRAGHRPDEPGFGEEPPLVGGGSCAATNRSRFAAPAGPGPRSTKRWRGRCATERRRRSTPTTRSATLEVLEAARHSAVADTIVAVPVPVPAPGRSPPRPSVVEHEG